jgi:hypothetical protein
MINEVKFRAWGILPASSRPPGSFLQVGYPISFIQSLPKEATTILTEWGLLNLNKKDFFKIMVPCPSPDVQKAIAEALTASQQEIDLLKQLADKYKTQKRGLMQKMLTGIWRIAPDAMMRYE